MEIPQHAGRSSRRCTRLVNVAVEDDRFWITRIHG
jgi:hypothetical protein